MLKKENRLTHKKDFDRAFRSAQKSVYGKLVGIKIAANGSNVNKYGIIVSTKISKNATDRNRIKRQIRQILKEYHEKVLKGYDVVIISLPAIKGCQYKEIGSEIFALYARIRFINKENV